MKRSVQLGVLLVCWLWVSLVSAASGVVNLSPVIEGVPATSVTANSTYSFIPTASDPEGSVLKFSIAKKPKWATFDAATGALTGTPTGVQAATYSGIVITVSDGKLKSSLPAFSIQVNNPAPTISGTPATSVQANSAYSFTPDASDANGDKLTFSIAKKPAWAAFSTTTGALTGTPPSAKAGLYSGIIITVSDGKTKVSLPVFSIQVNNPAPTISGTPATSVQATSPYSFTPSASDTNGDKLTFSIAKKPAWATFSTTTGALTGTPLAKHVGVTKGISIAVTDGKIKVSLPAFDLQVSAVALNKAPVISGRSATTVNVGSAYSFIPTASDADTSDILTFSITNKPTWATVDTATGQLSGTPVLADVGTTSGIIISVSDGKQTVSLPAFALRVMESINLARQFGVATQGADYDSSSAASLAIDGNASTFNHTTCTAQKNWWQVQLPNPTLISKLVVTSRNSWTSRINGAGVYVSNAPYNGTLNESDKVATLSGVATAQITTFSTPKSGAYVIVKAAADNCLHMSEVEVYGSAPASPHLDQSAYTFQLSNSTAIGKTVGTVKAVDYQLDSISYALEGSSIPFAIDAQGKITVKAALQAGVTYTFDVVVSDGANVSRAPITVNVTASSSVEDALRTGDASVATSEELLDETISALASKKATSSLLTALYGSDPIAYAPGNSTQWLNLKSWVDTTYPILTGTQGNTLAMAGATASTRYAAFGVPPTDLFKANQSLGFEAPFSRLLAWLLAGEPVNTAVLTNSRTIALSMSASGSRSNFKTWITQKYPNWTVVDCNTVSALATCYNAAAMVVTDGGSSSSADATPVRQALANVMMAGKPILYLHTGTWGSNSVSLAIADLLNFSLPYGGNFWANDAANWTNVTAMQTATWEKQGLAGVETMLKHFKANDFSIATRNTEFYPGANKVRAVMTSLDESKINLFQSNESRLYRLLALLGDSYRQEVVFPMDMDATNPNVFLKSLFTDHAVYNYRTLNRVQADMGNFSRSDFSHITPVTKTVTLTSRQNFRAAGVYALPGKTVRVTRTDNSSTTTKVFINSLRSGSTHEFEAWGYKRPKFLQSAHVPIKSGETITLTSPYGGSLQLEFSTNDQSVSFTFEQVGEHPFWDDTSDNATFTAKLAAGEYDWAEFVTPAFEIHSTLEKMRESAADTRWGGTLEGFAAATMRYIHNFPHVLAGFQGPNIDVVPEIHDFATANDFTIENLDLVKHMNADQATCGSGCSGNPYDAYWAFSPIGHGDIHELGHGLEKSRFRLEGWNYHASTNPYSYYSKTQYYKTTGGNPDCQSLPFKDAFVALQASIGQANPAAYLKTNYWDAESDNWSRGASMTIQMMMIAEHQGALQDGWHLLARLHILEREFNRARSDTTTWDAKKTSLGFASYSKAEADAISSNDWMVIAVSKVTGMDYRDYFSMWGQAFSTKANDQVAAFNHAAAERRFFITSPNGYCKGEGFDGNNLPVNGSQVWPLAGAQPRLMGDSFR